MQSDSIDESRRKLRRALDAWFELIPDFFPPGILEAAPRSNAFPENETLSLPSEYAADIQKRLGLVGLGQTEWLLRLGLAHDALGKLRQALGLKSFLIRKKRRMAGGQGILLRSEAEITRAGRHIKKWREVYKRSWKALTCLLDTNPDLGSEESWTRLQELKDEDCIMLSQWIDDHRLWQEKGERAEAAASEKGKGKRDLPWFWKMQFPAAETSTSLSDNVHSAIETWTNDGVFVFNLICGLEKSTIY